jgi:Domain of unknown function (DUF305)
MSRWESDTATAAVPQTSGHETALRTSRRHLLRAGSIAALLAVAGCASGNATTTAPAAPALSAGQAGFFGGTDLAWVEINIAMDEQLLPLLALVPAKAASADVKAYATSVEQVTQAGAASGAGFDKLLLKRVREHLEQGTSLATSEEKAGVEPQTLALAKLVLTTRATAIQQADALSAA